jgi:hypothetical protein
MKHMQNQLDTLSLSISIISEAIRFSCSAAAKPKYAEDK